MTRAALRWPAGGPAGRNCSVIRKFEQFERSEEDLRNWLREQFPERREDALGAQDLHILKVVTNDESYVQHVLNVDHVFTARLNWIFGERYALLIYCPNERIANKLLPPVVEDMFCLNIRTNDPAFIHHLPTLEADELFVGLLFVRPASEAEREQGEGDRIVEHTIYFASESIGPRLAPPDAVKWVFRSSKADFN